jgi:hypothetical protein
MNDRRTVLADRLRAWADFLKDLDKEMGAGVIRRLTPHHLDELTNAFARHLLRKDETFAKEDAMRMARCYTRVAEVGGEKVVLNLRQGADGKEVAREG